MNDLEGRFPLLDLVNNTVSSDDSYGLNDYNSYLRDLLREMKEEYESRRDVNGLEKAIQVNSVDFSPRDSARKHNTQMYELVESSNPALILRRGLSFFATFQFNRNYDPKKDQLKLEMTFGSNPQVAKGTLVVLPIKSNDSFKEDNTQWDVRLHSYNRSQVTVQVHIPVSVGIGIWKMKVISLLRSSDSQPVSSSKTYKCKENIYILFNPWNKDDAVYMQDDKLKREYVLNDVGKIYVGSFHYPTGRQWIFGQFKDSVLPACMFLLERSGLKYSARSNPIKVARAVSAMVNDLNDKGVVVGRWHEPYDDGVAPWKWTGSSAILEEYMKTEGVSVKYGQCWVFAGVCNTVCRALGLPCRPVSTFVSAHDSDATLTIDRLFNKDGEEISGGTNDSIWNFHVWNECWMARPDLPTGYGGWQIIDSTPQETSEGIYQLGPTSLVAVKRGETGYMYDTPFVYAEVNADIVYWQKDRKSENGWKRLKTDTSHVGRLILTKKVGVDDDFGINDAQDITYEYKNKEGTEEERISVRNATRNATLSHRFDLRLRHKEDVHFEILETEQVMIGQPFRVRLKIRNLSSEPRKVSAVLSANTVYYNGITAKKLKRKNDKLTLQPQQEELISFGVESNEYLDKLVDYAMIKIYALTTVKETEQTWSGEDDFVLNKPKLDLMIRGTPKVGRPIELVISFTNPLKRILDDCVFSIEGSGVTGPYRTKFRDISPGETVTHGEKLVPQKAGLRKICVTFSSRQLIQLMGSKQVEVKPQPELDDNEI
ncbi:hemocyte protein-glutamine gamma-glutamyltransferase-like [Tachypleus tridentatus]|uniref:hemocyte protein-glutamine gamma-glutamyltransferase-like n=1 Tax=Tachypleus tridentatus TaxID=6853 RepID=UPI003FD13CBF